MLTAGQFSGTASQLVKQPVEWAVGAMRQLGIRPSAVSDQQRRQLVAGGGHTPLDAQLDLMAQCVEAGVSTRVFSVSLGGFDTHADEKQLQAVLLGMLDRALTRFVDRMNRTDAGRKVAVAVYYATLLERVLDSDPAPVLNGWRGRLDGALR